MKPIEIRPAYNIFSDSNAAINAFYAGSYFRKTGSDVMLSVHDFDDGDFIKIVYMRVIDDFNFGDRNTIDRTVSVSFTVQKDEVTA